MFLSLRKQSQETLRSAGSTSASPEPFSAKGFGHGRSVKGLTKKKHLPFLFTSSDGASCRSSTRRPDVVAIHEAAIRSATDLTGVNTMHHSVRSPPSFSPLSSRLRTARSTPIPGRPRSNTAPTASGFDIHPMEPAELEGSIPAYFDSDSIRGHSTDDQSARSTRTPPDRVTSALDVRRPSSASLIRRELPGTSPAHAPPNGLAELNADSNDVLMASESGSTSTTRSIQPPVAHLLSISSTPQSLRFPNAGTGSSTRLQDSTPSAAFQQQTQLLCPPSHPPVDIETLLMEQISSIRTAHDAHLISLREAHAKEVSSMASYISFLEQRRSTNPGSSQTRPQTIRQPLSIDTQLLVNPNGSQSETPATALQTNDVQDIAAEMESLKRRLHEVTERSQRKVIQLKNILREYKENGQTLKSNLLSVEARLEMANVQRADLLDGFNEAEKVIQDLAKRQKTLTLEREQLLAKIHIEPTTIGLTTSLTNHVENNTSADVRKKIEDSPITLKNDLFLQQLVEMKKLIKEKNHRIRELEQALSSLGHFNATSDQHESNEQSRTLAALLTQLEDCQARLSKAEADRDQYNLLLHSELRKQARSSMQKASVLPLAKIEAEASHLTSERLKLFPKSDPPDAGAGNSQSMREDFLEAELKHAFGEIILFKLDIKSYKKELKQTAAKMQTLQAQAAALQIPPTPESTVSTKRRHRQPSATRNGSSKERRSGLGISLSDEAKAPTRSTTSATATSHLSIKSAPTSTSMYMNKQLPSLPSPLPKPKTPGSLTTTTLSPASPRQHPLDPLRSLSESRSSPHGKQYPPEKAYMRTPPTRGRSCEPLIESPRGVPTSKFSMAEQVPI